MLSLNTSTSHVQPPPVTGKTRHMLTPLSEPGEFLFVIDNSAAERFVCPTLARNYIVEGREAHPTNAALIFGGALHVGIETLLRGPKLLLDSEETLGVDKWESDDDLLIRAASDLTLHFTKHPAPMDEYRTLANALEVLKHYRDRCRFPDYKIEIQSDEKGLLVERAFELPLGVLEIGDWVSFAHGISYAYPTGSKTEVRDGILFVWVDRIHVAWAGRIDVVAHCNRKNRVVDHKSAYKYDTAFVEDFQLSSQTRGYVWAGRQLWPELNIDGFCLDSFALRRPSAGCGLMDRGPRGGEPALQMHRDYYDYSDESIANWVNNQMLRVEDFIHSMVRGEYPMETTYCHNRKYGRCPYLDCCMIEISDPKAAMNLLHSDAYRPVTWDPTHER